MNIRRFIPMAAPMVALALAACGGGGGSGLPGSIPTAVPSGPTNGATQRVKISLIVPSNPATAAARHPSYISTSALGASIAVTQGATTVNAVLDLSSGSTACSGTGSARTCTTSITVPIGADTFTVTVYNQAPSGNAIPSGAHILGIGTTSVNVVAGVTTGVPIFIGGEVAGYGATLPSGSVAANGQPQSIGIVIAPTDFGDNAIVAGQNDPYANPITVAITQTGGSGHATLSLNGGTATSSVVLTKSNDAVTVTYDGLGTPGYTFTIALSANGVSTQSSTVTPLIAALGGSMVTSVGLNGTASSPTLTYGEAGTTRTYTPALSNCTNIATLGSQSGSGASASLPLHGGTAPSATGCTLSLTDSLGTVLTLAVTNTPVTGNVAVGGTSFTEYGGFGNPYGIATGPDGNIWFTDQSNNTLNAINPSGGSTIYQYSVSGSLYDLTTGSDGALWVADQSNEGADRVTTSGNVTSYPFTGTPEGIITAADGTMWIADNTSGGLWNLTAGGAFTIAPFSPSGTPSHVTQAPDGTIWFTEGSYVGRYDPSTSSVNEVATPGGSTSNYIATGPDGAIWFTATGGAAPFIGRIDPTTGAPYTITQPLILGGGSSPQGIASGVDRAVWYVDQGLNTVGRVSTASGNTASSYPIPTASSGALEIARGPDGSLWFTENTAGKIGRVVP